MVVDIQALRDALDANDFLSVDDDIAVEAISQYGNGVVFDPIGQSLVDMVSIDRPDLNEYDGYDLASIIYRDYCQRI